MQELLTFWASVSPFLLPLLLPIGRLLKGVNWFSNKAIPLTLVAVNFVLRVLPQLGWGKLGDTGQVEPMGAVVMPGVMLAFAFGGGALMSMLGAAVQLGVDHFMVNNAHKGLKYRAMWKAAQAGGLLPDLGAVQVKKQVRW